jgi:hypothetical protein
MECKSSLYDMARLSPSLLPLCRLAPVLPRSLVSNLDYTVTEADIKVGWHAGVVNAFAARSRRFCADARFQARLQIGTGATAVMHGC